MSELTIEDPSEHFEDLRDRNDLTRLRKLLGQSKEILAGAPVDKAWMEKTRKKLKYAKVCNAPHLRRFVVMLIQVMDPQRQFLRIIEIMLLEQLKYRQGDPDAYKALRLQVCLSSSTTAICPDVMHSLQVKERLYRFNYEILSQLEPDERKQKLQETYANVEEDYKRLLASTESSTGSSASGTGRWKWIDV